MLDRQATQAGARLEPLPAQPACVERNRLVYSTNVIINFSFLDSFLPFHPIFYGSDRSSRNDNVCLSIQLSLLSFHSAISQLSRSSLSSIFQLSSTTLSALSLSHTHISESHNRSQPYILFKLTSSPMRSHIRTRSDGGVYSDADLQMGTSCKLLYLVRSGSGEVGEGHTFRSTI